MWRHDQHAPGEGPVPVYDTDWMHLAEHDNGLLIYDGDATDDGRYDVLETGLATLLGNFENRCRHEVVVEMLGERLHAPTLLAQLERAEQDLRTLGGVGRMYLETLEADPSDGLLSFAQAMGVGFVRQAVERAEALV